MDDRHEDWYGRGEDRRRNKGRRFSDRETEPPRPYRRGDVRTLYPRGGYPSHEARPYRGGPLGSELRDPYEPERTGERNRTHHGHAYGRWTEEYRRERDDRPDRLPLSGEGTLSSPHRDDTEMIYYSPYGGPERLPERPSGRFTGRGPKGYQRSDERIREDVCDHLADDSLVDASEMEVTVSDGEVTLSGNAHAREEKRRVEDIIERISGVRDVHNQLRVSRGRREEP